MITIQYSHTLGQVPSPAIEAQGLVQYCWTVLIVRDQNENWLTAVTIATAVITLRILLLPAVSAVVIIHVNTLLHVISYQWQLTVLFYTACIDYEVRLDNQSFSGSVESCLSYNWQSITIVSTASVSVSVVGATRLRVQWTPLVDERISLSAYHEVVCKFISSDITSPVEGQNTLFKRVPPSIQSTTINGVWPRSIYNCCVRVSVSNTLSLPTCASNIFSSSGEF